MLLSIHGTVIDANTAGDVETPRDGGHTIPTLLSIVHPETGKYINALENPLYEHFKTAVIANHRVHGPNNDEGPEPQTHHAGHAPFPKLWLDKKRLLDPNDSITVSWTNGHHGVTGKSLIADDDLIALYCANNRMSLQDDDAHSIKFVNHDEDSEFLEVATIAQIRATSSRHLAQLRKGRKDHVAEINSWYIPRFPILRKRICQFVLYTNKREDNSRTKSSTTATRTPDEQEGSTPDATETEATTKTPIAYSDIIKLYNPLTPTAIHLAFGTSNSSMVVQFTTGYYDQKYVPVVRYGKASNSMPNSPPASIADGTSQTYAASDLCESPANQTEAGKFYPPGMLHSVELSNLDPDTAYAYQVGLMLLETEVNNGDQITNDGATSVLASGSGINSIVWSDEYTFLSPLPVAGEDVSNGDYSSNGRNDTLFSYVVYGDQGCPESGWGYDGGVAVSHAMVNEVTKSELPIRSVHHIGDLAYSNGAGHIWDEWFRMLSPFSTMIPLMVSVGNHVSRVRIYISVG